MMPARKIDINSRVSSPEHPEYGFGTVKLIEDNLLEDHRTCQVAFDWIPGLTSIPDVSLSSALQVQMDGQVPLEEWGSVEDLQRRLGAALAIAENSRTGSFIRSFATPLPHQAYLLEKVVAHNRLGHVIADDVGMGKTIEAGLIIASLRQQNPRARVLILAPAGVVLQWQDEMDEHFGLAFSIVGRDFNAGYLPGWTNNALALASLDTLKRNSYEEILKQIPNFDLVVCDEAHRLTMKREFLTNDLQATRNYRFVEWLTNQRVVEWVTRGDGEPRSPRLLLLSATPHQGDNLRFAYLLQLARPDQIQAEQAVEPDGALAKPAVLEECITRTAKKRAVDWSGNPIFKGHDSSTIDVELSEHEKQILTELTKYVLETMQFSGEGNALVRALAMHTFQKIAASSWAALESALRNRLGEGAKITSSEPTGEGSMGEEFECDPDDKERSAIRDLLGRIEGVAGGTKWKEFAALIAPGAGFRQAGDRLLIFTQYRRTQEWLTEQLVARGEKVALIHGGLSLDERKAQRISFESEGSVLISTEAGSEGANLHRQCHLEVNYDLPWNPMRLLQRIGRLDRYGQKHRVQVINLRAPLSWDSEISAKIAAKLESVQANMGLVADEDYRAMILGEVHEAINVAELMKRANWGRDAQVIDREVDEAFRDILARKNALDRLFMSSLGMPEDYGRSAPVLGPEDFRQAFAWSASGQGVHLMETRTSNNRYLKGVYHFTLPPAFRGGLRASREAYLVFDRDTYAEVRNEVLGRARGQEIKPSLAGFGDPVTDWFFRSGLQARVGGTVFCLRRASKVPVNVTWWITFAARWKQPSNWAGPDALFTFAVNNEGECLAAIPSEEVFQELRSAQRGNPSEVTLPPVDAARAASVKELRSALPKGGDTRHLALLPLSMIYWEP